MDEAFWREPELAAALAGRHMGRVIRAWRRHPARDRPLPQEAVAELAGLTQAQLSRIETGPPIVHLDRLIHWARLLEVPGQLLWFTLPGEGEPVNRSQFLRLGAVSVAAAAVGAALPPLGEEAAVEEFAWTLWSLGRASLHPAELEPGHARALASSTFVALEPDGSYALAHRGLVDFFVARRIFGSVADADSALFAGAQTSHDTDHVLRGMVARDGVHVDTLTRWMLSSPDPVLRVNSAGVLAKLGRDQTTAAVVTALRGDEPARARYAAAVAARVLNLGWDDASAVAAAGPVPAVFVEQLAGELGNVRDGAARWCSLLLLAGRHDEDLVADRLRRALREETVPENLRAIGAVLSGRTPLEV